MRLSPETRAVIDAVREALDIPAAAPYPGDRERRAEVLDARARVLLYHLGRLVDVADRREGGRVDVQARMASLRSWLAAYPATGYAQADGDGDGGRENDGWACVVCGVDYTATPELIPNVPVAIVEAAVPLGTMPMYQINCYKLGQPASRSYARGDELAEWRRDLAAAGYDVRLGWELRGEPAPEGYEEAGS
ncbi:MAG: hypothetical protein IRZ07_20100 [Microbispora sp.]|nr:hypothetical protein [Microbispora sp.]